MVKAVDNDGYPTPPQGMADFYQNLFEMLGFKNPYRSKIDPKLPIQEQLSHFLRRNGPVHNDLTNREYLTKYGDTSRSHVVPTFSSPNYPDHPGHAQTGYGSNTIIPRGDYAGWSASEAIKDNARQTPVPRSNMPNRPDENNSVDESNNIKKIPNYPAHRSVPPSYTPPENFFPEPSFMKSRPGTFPP